MPKLEYDKAKTMALICERMIEGQSLRSICREDGMPGKTTVMRWLGEDDEGGALRDQYARAREAMADAMAEDILEIADDTSFDTIKGDRGEDRPQSEWIARSRLRVD